MESKVILTENSVKMSLLSMSSRSSVDRAPARCSGGHGSLIMAPGPIPVGTQIFLCPTLVSCWIFHISHLITELKIHYLHSLITTHDEFGSADPSSVQDTCHIWTQFSWVLVAQWIERLPGVREVMGSIPVGDSDFFLCPTLVSCWLIHLSQEWPSFIFNSPFHG